MKLQNIVTKIKPKLIIILITLNSVSITHMLFIAEPLHIVVVLMYSNQSTLDNLPARKE